MSNFVKSTRSLKIIVIIHPNPVMSTRVKISANLIQAGANNSFNTFKFTHINLICSQSTLQIRKGVLIVNIFL